MASQACNVSGSDDCGRRKPRLAASLQINPAPSSWRSSGTPGVDARGLLSGPEAEGDAQGRRRPQASAAAVGIGGPRAEAETCGEREASRAGDNAGGGLRTAPRVPVPPTGPAGDLLKVSGQLQLPPSSQAVTLLTQYAEAVGAALTFREDPAAGELGKGLAMRGAASPARVQGPWVSSWSPGEGWGAGPEPGPPLRPWGHGSAKHLSDVVGS